MGTQKMGIATSCRVSRVRVLVRLICIHGLIACTGVVAAGEPPAEWVDPDTGHTVVRLSAEPGSSSLYFNYNGYTADGTRLVFSTPHGISAVDLRTRKITAVVSGEVKLLFVGRHSSLVYYARRDNDSGTAPLGAGVIYAADIGTGKSKEVARIARGSIGSINADESLLAGTAAERDMPLASGDTARKNKEGAPLTYADSKEVGLNERLEARIPMELFTVNLKTAERKVIHRATDWLNHVQFSPTDPGLILFCHEGPWHKVDRIWTIRTDGSGLTRIHRRTMNMEIAGHEFFSPDGNTIWYDLQTPRGEDFWLAGYEIATGKRTWYHLQRDEWSVHFNIAPDGRSFLGDGGDSEMVAHAKDGKWLYLFHPEPVTNAAGIGAPDENELIHPGTLRAQRLVNLSRHQYKLEPNATFSPDGKWIVFRSNMHGGSQVYAVEVAKSH
jgi:oligogalacturonide lyase